MKTEKKYWPGLNSNTSSGMKKAYNREALDKEMNVEGAITLFALSRPSREGAGSLQQQKGLGHHRLECPESAPGHGQASL